ncbi:MAG: DUF2147 domain-containing protein [Cyclobacteriaceae bacterium]|nr:DUF2147 domain-containing protein [Cyclobacteriaceae bacterium HetDA_MAG_MS6]
MMKYLFFCSLLTFALLSNGQSIVGKWKTVDDNSGKTRSEVEIYEKEGLVFGKILKIYTEPGEDPDPICTDCDEDDPRYKQKIIGMEIIRNMKYDKKDDEYRDGDILDPENGSVYDCKLWTDEEGNLKVRGYIMFLYRTQTWLRVEG